ncbi:ubiquitin carboxyl-terminal hydrolase 15 [Monosporozyma servazzii]
MAVAAQYGEILPETCDLGKEFEETLPEMEDQETECLGNFTWHIDNWFALKESKYVSPRVKIGDFEWSVLMFPNGNQNKGVAVYLAPHPREITDEETGETTPENPDWYCCAQFAVTFSRPGDDATVHTVNRSYHRFDSSDADWGFANIIYANHLKYPSKARPQPLLNDGALNISVFVRILKDPTGVLWHNFINYDSKKETGYVGFKNQGATCYLNSLLQSYFFTKYFRKLVYEIPTEKESPNNSVPMALQRAFYQLQNSDEPLDTLELTRSFGWDSGDAFTQHDVQELNRILMDRLENRMKGTPVEGTLNNLFVGKMKSYIRCINVDYESSRVEDFWDLQLNVKNLKGLEDSFKNYIEIELMNGENQYAAQGHGLQDAEKGVIFESFPPILHLQLKRFEYDFNYDQLVKINDRYEFPESIDVSPFLDKNSSQVDQPDAHVYNLHGVLVHAGDISTGHYYTMIKPDVKDKWYRFDDERVWEVTKKQAFDENFGLERLPEEQIKAMSREQYQEYIMARHTSAYMLVYIRKDREEELLQPVTNEDVPKHIIARVEEETKEHIAREKELRDAHLYLNIKVHSLSNFINFEGLETVPNPIFKYSYDGLNNGKEQPVLLKVERTKTLKELYDEIKKHLLIPKERDIRCWNMSMRQNSTLRASAYVDMKDAELTLDSVLALSEESAMQVCDIFVEEPYLDLTYLVQLKKQGKIKFNMINDALIRNMRDNLETYLEECPITAINEMSNLVFIKQFDIPNQRLSGFGHALVSSLDTIAELKAQLNQIIDKDGDLNLFEEINVDNIAIIPDDLQFVTAEIGTGDIIAFELQAVKDKDREEKHPACDNILKYYKFLGHRVKLKFTKSVESQEEYIDDKAPTKNFEIWVSAYITYETLSNIVSNEIGCDPAYLKLFAIYSNGRYALKSNSILNDYLIKDFDCSAMPPFEYEVLSIPLKEFEHLRPVKFYWLNNSYLHFQCFEFEVPGTCTVKEFLDRLQKKIGISDKQKEQTLLWTNNHFKFEMVLSFDVIFKQIPRDSLIFGRVLPDELLLLTNKQNSGSESDTNSSTPEIDMEDSVGSLNINKTKISRDKIIIVTQFFKELENRHGISFLFKLIPDEKFPDTRERLHKLFGLGQKEFSKIKLGVLIQHGHRMSIKTLTGYTDEELDRIVLFDKMKDWDSIVMDHPDRLRSHSTGDRPMFIKN